MTSQKTTVSRHFPLDGVFNVRDLGGYPTQDGKQTRSGRFLRSDNIGQLSEAAQQKLVDWGLKTIIDLRFQSEVDMAVHCFASHECVKYFHISLLTDAVMADRQVRVHLYEFYVFHLENAKEEFRQVMEILAAPDSLPALFHCLAGKDRTGLIAGLLLSLVKVPNGIIADDYAQTKLYIAPLIELWREQEIEKGGDLKMFDRNNACDPRTMLKTLEHLDEKYGGAEGYLLSAGVKQESLDRLKAALVE